MAPNESTNVTVPPSVVGPSAQLTVSPVAAKVPFGWAVSLNPMAAIVEAFRASIFGRPVDSTGLLYAAVVALFLIASGSIYFRRLERLFADVM